MQTGFHSKMESLLSADDSLNKCKCDGGRILSLRPTLSCAPLTHMLPTPPFFDAHMSAGKEEEEQMDSPLGFEETERSTNIAATTLPQRLLPMVQPRAKWNGYESMQTPHRTGNDFEQQEPEVKSPVSESLWEERVSRSTGRTYW